TLPPPHEGQEPPKREREEQGAVGLRNRNGQRPRRRDVLRTAAAPRGGGGDGLGANPQRGKGTGRERLTMGSQREGGVGDEPSRTALVTNTGYPIKGVGGDTIEMAPRTTRPRVLEEARGQPAHRDHRQAAPVRLRLHPQRWA